MKSLFLTLLASVIPSVASAEAFVISNGKINIEVLDSECVLGHTVFPSDRAVEVRTVDGKQILTGCIKVLEDGRIILGLNLTEKIDGKDIVLLEIDPGTFKKLGGV